MKQLSVLMPVYNSREFVGSSIESVLSQDYGDFELIIIDDGSTDDSLNIVRQYESDPRVTVVTQCNQGLAKTLNRGLDMCSTKYVARIDSDDVALPERLGTQVSYLQSHPEVVLVGSQVLRVSRGITLSMSRFPLEHDSIVRGLIRGQHVLAHPSVMFTLEAARRVGGYWSYGVAEDWDFYLKLSEVGTLANIDAPLLAYRFHDGGINASSLRNVRTNIEFAVARHRMRNAEGIELSFEEFCEGLGSSARLRICSQTLSLGFYRRALALSGEGGLATHLRKSLFYSAAAVMWPTQAMRRVEQRFHDR